ncbi:MAG: hypothetical protein AB7G11_02500 [Phycisphaerales bacterium]
MDHYILNDRQPVRCDDIVEFARWRQANEELRRVGCDILPGGVFVSTVFLGLDHNFEGHGPPVLFETMILAPSEHPLSDWTDRYATWDEAEAGHARAVKLVEESRKP